MTISFYFPPPAAATSSGSGVGARYYIPEDEVLTVPEGHDVLVTDNLETQGNVVLLGRVVGVQRG